MLIIVWENSRHHQVLRAHQWFPSGEAWGTRAEIPYCWRFTTQIWVFWLAEANFQPIGSTAKVCVVTRHQYGISVLGPQRGKPVRLKILAVSSDYIIIHHSFIRFYLKTLVKSWTHCWSRCFWNRPSNRAAASVSNLETASLNTRKISGQYSNKPRDPLLRILSGYHFCLALTIWRCV